MIVVNASIQALGHGCVNTAYSTNIHSLSGSPLTSAEYTHGIVCPVKEERDVFLTLLLSSFTDLDSRRVALLTVLLSFGAFSIVKILLVALWQDLLLAASSSSVACKDVQLYLQCTLLISSPSLLLIFF